MNLQLHRHTINEDVTLGYLYVNGTFECHTLERPERGLEGPLAIPAGLYSVVLKYSPKFHVVLPCLLNVPGRSAIEIHMGNTGADTSGCILVGQSRQGESLLKSRLALEALIAKLHERTLADEPLWIQITEPQEGQAV